MGKQIASCKIKHSYQRLDHYRVEAAGETCNYPKGVGVEHDEKEYNDVEICMSKLFDLETVYSCLTVQSVDIA